MRQPCTRKVIKKDGDSLRIYVFRKMSAIFEEIEVKLGYAVKTIIRCNRDNLSLFYTLADANPALDVHILRDRPVGRKNFNIMGYVIEFAVASAALIGFPDLDHFPVIY